MTTPKPFQDHVVGALLAIGSTLCVLVPAVKGQDAAPPPRQYMRPSWASMTATPDNEQERLILDNFSNFGLPTKFDVHGTPVKRLDLHAGADKKGREQALALALAPHTAEVVARWFNRDSAGGMDTRTIMDRGLYSETDLDRIINQLSSVNRSGSQGWQLLGQTFIAVYDVKSVKRVEKQAAVKALNALSAFADAAASAKSGTQSSPQKKNIQMEGYKVEYTTDLYQLDWSDSVETRFAQRYWNDRDNPDPTKVAAWAGATFPLRKVTTFTGHVSAMREKKADNPPLDAAVLPNMAKKMHNEAVRHFGKHVSDLRPRAGVVSDYPLHAKLGTKESVRVNDRFVAFKYKQGKKTTKLKRVGVTRAYKVVKNENVADGRSASSVFQQQGGRLVQRGMLLEERHDLGVNVSGGWTMAAGDLLTTGPAVTVKTNVLGRAFKFPNFYFGVDYGRVYARDLDASGLSVPKKLDSLMTRNGEPIEPGRWSGTGSRFGLLLSKEFYLMKRGNLYVEPTLAWYWTAFRFTDNGPISIGGTYGGETVDAGSFKYKAGMFALGCGIAHHFGPFALELRPTIGYRGKMKYSQDEDVTYRTAQDITDVTEDAPARTGDGENLKKDFEASFVPAVMGALKIRF